MGDAVPQLCFLSMELPVYMVQILFEIVGITVEVTG